MKRKMRCKHLYVPVLLVLLLSLLALPALMQPALAADPGAHTAHGAGETFDTAWSATAGEVTTGHYYLTDDFSGVSGDVIINGDVTLCLNGYTLDLEGCSICPRTGATFTLCDCAGGGQLITSGTGAIALDSYYHYDGNVHVYSGTISGSPAIQQAGTGEVIVYGGTLRGQNSAITSTAGSVEIRGGAVHGTRDAALVHSNGSLLIAGGHVESANKYAITISSGSFMLSGSPAIVGGQDGLGNKSDDVHLQAPARIEIVGALQGMGDSMSVYVSNTSYPYTFTEGWSTYMDGEDYDDYFEGSSLYVDHYKLREGDDGELQFAEHIHSWGGRVEGNVLTVLCTRADGLSCEALKAQNYVVGTVSLQAPADLVYNATMKEATVSNTLPSYVGEAVSAIFYEQEGDNGWEGCATPMAVGQYRAGVTVTVDDTLDETVYLPFAISFLETNAAATISGEHRDVESVRWYVGDVTLTAPAGYEISKTLDSGYTDAIMVDADRMGAYTYYLKNAAGQYAEKTVALNRDTTAPTLESISLGTVGDTSATLTVVGSDVVGLGSYSLLYWKQDTQQQADGQTVDQTSGSFTLSALTPNTAYAYVVTLKDKLGNTYTSPVQTAFTTQKTSINGATVSVRGSYTYNGTAHLPGADDVSVRLAGGALLPADQYTISASHNIAAGTATLTVTAKADGDYSGEARGSFTIAACSLSGASASLDRVSFIYGGGEQVPTVTATANGEALVAGRDYTVTYLRGSRVTTDLTTAGDITVRLAGQGNYSGTLSAGTYTIAQKELSLAAKEQFIDEGDRMAEGVDQVTATGLVMGDGLSAVTLVKSGHDILCSAAVIKNAQGEDVTANYQITYVNGVCHTLAWDAETHAYDCTQPGCTAGNGVDDQKAPTGTLTVTAGAYTATTTALHTTIDFTQYCRSSLRLTVTASDEGAGMSSIAYYLADQALSAAALEALDEWQPYRGEVAVRAEEGKRLAVYVRLADLAGNVTYLSTDRGVIFELTDSKVDRLVVSLDAYTIPTVKSSDKADIEAIKAEIAGLLAGTTLTADERITLQDLTKYADALLQRISEVAAEIQRLTIALEPYHIRTVTSDDVEDLLALMDDVDLLLEGDNLTEEERAAVQNLRFTIQWLMERTDMIAAEIARITKAINAYVPATVGLGDQADIEALIKAIDALYDYETNLTKKEIETLEELRKKAEALLESVAKNAANNTDSLLDDLYRYDIDTVISIDQVPITRILNGIKALLGTDLPSDEQRKELNAGIPYAEALLSEIKKNSDELARLLAAVNGYDVLTVTSADRAAIEQLIRDMDALAATEHLTDDERAALSEARAKAEALLARIEEAARALITVSTYAATKINESNFNLTDKATLEQAILDLEKALTDYNGNYTEGEKADIAAEIARLEALLHSIKRVTAVQNAIGLLPEGSSMKDSDIAEAVGLIEEAYAKLTEREKTLVDRSALDAIIGQKEPYKITQGNGSSWQKGSEFSLPFVANGELADFVGLKIDGVLINEIHYTTVDRDTVINLLSTYLETIALGPHTLTVLYTDGEATCQFTITANSGGGCAGDATWLIVLIVLLCLAAGGYAVYRVMVKERRRNRRF